MVWLAWLDITVPWWSPTDMEVKMVVCNTTLTAGFLQRCHHIYVTQRKMCVLPALSQWECLKAGLCLAFRHSRWVMDENNYVEHPLAWHVQAGGEVGCRVAPCDIITVKHACSFLGPSPLHHPAQTLPSVSNPLPVYRRWVAGPGASPGLNTIHFNNTTSLQAAGKGTRT